MIETDQLSSRDTVEDRIHIKNLNLTLNNHVLDEKDSIKIFDFIIRFVDEADMSNMSESKELISLTPFLAYTAETEICASLSEASRHVGVRW